MKDVIRQFTERSAEINIYFEHLEDLLVHDGIIKFPSGSEKPIGLELAQILRANGFLLLYNLIEASISLSIEQIHLAIVAHGGGYNIIKGSIRKEIIKFIKKDVPPDKFIDKVKDIMIDIVSFYPENRKIFSGNVDAKQIRQIADKYGFSCETDKSLTRDGGRLVIVKDRRNDLAHGAISFQECGKDYTIQDMVTIKDEVIAYIGEILNNIEDYINKQEFVGV